MNPLLITTLVALSFLPTFEEGTQAYDAQDYATSANRFEELVYNRVYEPEVFHNLGNAYYRMGYLGPAIANYERALHLDPSLQATQANLRMAVSQTKRAMPGPARGGMEDTLYLWHIDWTADSSRMFTFAFWTIGWAALMLRFAKPMPFLRRIAVFSFLVTAFFAGSWWYKANPVNLAVANGDKIPVHYGPKNTDTVHFELFEGDRVAIDTVRDEWVRVTMADGTRGWTRSEYLLTVWPPLDSGVDERLRSESL